MARIVCFGEVLWDVFPTHKKIGGAPLNVASRLQSFEHDVTMISAIGKGESGAKIMQYLKDCGINMSCVQVLSEYKTGKVKVMLNEKGSASYDIKFPRAWDKIELTDKNKETIKTSDAFVYGSLVARDDKSRHTLFELLKMAKLKIFDVNLREPYYTKEVLIHLMNEANFIKFNDDELFQICKSLGSKYNALEQNIRYISEKTNTKNICVTKGRHGAVLLFKDEFFYNSGYQINVVDTVGAGDSFLASLISQLLSQKNPQDAIDYACAVGALVAQSEGANPKISQKEILKFINPYD